ncbi:hypothetical protein DL96DRAFT_1187666 [Flagelloscypha sp. PMI_526]|nr:hypothetical protein DL96DRAFT_1187666 [Flagelloscypha sp. PMI_526]
MHPTPAGMYPSLLPPGMDPAHVDLRTFYPYQPNEVKHRKRTTSAQLKVLEGIFKTDTKPNAALRTRLAAQLDMTPRGVQVWFQNRRAKEKLKASKAAAAAAAASRKGRNANEGSESEDRKEDIDDDEESTTPPAVQFDTPSPTVESPVTQLPVPPTNSPGIRRPSLPTSNGHEMVPPNFDPHTRRASVDPNLLRYATNPYARPNHLLSRVPGRPGPYPMRPNAMHRPSMPILPSAGLQGFTAQPGQAPLYSPRGSLPDNSLYMSHARPLEPSPIPAGPLPQPGFSFGAASSTLSPESAGSSERNSPDSLQQYSFPGQPRTALPEFDEDDDSSLYGGQSTRFGSITSVASRDSFYSDLSDMHPAGFMADHRRGSSTSGFPTTMMSALDMNGASEGADGRTLLSARLRYLSVAAVNGATNNEPNRTGD